MEFTDRVNRATWESLQGGLTDPWELTRRVYVRLGPYPAFMIELRAGVRAHIGVLGPA